MITFTRSVGTSPGTTVVARDNGLTTLGIQQCWPVPQPIHIAPNQGGPRAAPKAKAPAAGPRFRVYDPYQMVSQMDGGLGFVLAPWEINRTLPNGHPYHKPFDPQYITRGERGYYYDTPLGGAQLGEIPTDAEFAKDICYTPVKSGWIYSKEGYIPPPYVPPDEWRPVAPQYGPPTSLSGLGSVEASLGQAADNLGDATDELAKHQRRMFYLSIISTCAVAAVATATIIRTLREGRS
jgi:hypothetical protein